LSRDFPMPPSRWRKIRNAKDISHFKTTKIW
jgi:hypothetical protein